MPTMAPLKEIMAPSCKKIERTSLLPEPKAYSTAMSFFFSIASMVREKKMLMAATAIMKEKVMNTNNFSHLIAIIKEECC